MSERGGNVEEYKQVIVVRADLHMSVGKLVSQACHACLEASEAARRVNPEGWEKWRREGGKKVVLKVSSLEELLELKREAERLGIPHAIIEDRGLTELPPGTVTALGVGPAKAQLVDRVTGGLKLL